MYSNPNSWFMGTSRCQRPCQEITKTKPQRRQVRRSNPSISRFSLLLLAMLQLLPLSLAISAAADRKTPMSHENMIAVASRESNAGPSCSYLLKEGHVRVVSSINKIPRGGQISISSGSSQNTKRTSSGWPSWTRFIPFFGRTKSVSQLYRETLEEQVFLLDRQLQSVREEVTALRAQMQSRSTSIKDAVAAEREAAVAAAAAAAAEAKALKQQIKTLEQQATQLEKMKNELERMLEKEQRKVEKLERALTEQEQLTNALRERYEHQLEQLQEELETKSQEQMAQMEALLEERVKQASEAARTAALAIVEQKVKEAADRLRVQKTKELEQERKKSAFLVEQEKIKMRKLVKALATREQKLMGKSDKGRSGKQMAEDKLASKTTTTARMTSAEAAAQMTRKAPPTTRGPI